MKPLTLASGSKNKIWVNPDHVVAVFPSLTDNACYVYLSISHVQQDDDWAGAIYVSGHADSIASILGWEE